MVVGMTHDVKICGITSLDDAMDAIELGADYLGFHITKDTSYSLKIETLQNILNEIPSNIQKVAVFENPARQFVIDVATAFNFDVLEFIGNETPAFCREFARPYWKHFLDTRQMDLANLKTYEAEAFIIPVELNIAQSGVVGHWQEAKDAIQQYHRIFIDGDITEKNVDVALQLLKPQGVNLLESVESEPGKKSYRKMETLIKKIKNLD